jgi:hypothetical protein
MESLLLIAVIQSFSRTGSFLGLILAQKPVDLSRDDGSPRASELSEE